MNLCHLCRPRPDRNQIILFDNRYTSENVRASAMLRNLVCYTVRYHGFSIRWLLRAVSARLDKKGFPDIVNFIFDAVFDVKNCLKQPKFPILLYPCVSYS